MEHAAVGSLEKPTFRGRCTPNGRIGSLDTPHRLVNTGDEFFALQGQERLQKSELIAKMVVEAHPGQERALSYFLHRGVVEAALGEHVQGGLENFDACACNGASRAG